MTRVYGNKNTRASGYKLKTPDWRDKPKPVNRVDTNVCVTTKTEPMEYTGDLVKGIALFHKSCYQPVISEEAIQDAARMRR